MIRVRLAFRSSRFSFSSEGLSNSNCGACSPTRGDRVANMVRQNPLVCGVYANTTHRAVRRVCSEYHAHGLISHVGPVRVAKQLEAGATDGFSTSAATSVIAHGS